jgi:hypothetical protein
MPNIYTWVAVTWVVVVSTTQILILGFTVETPNIFLGEIVNLGILCTQILILGTKFGYYGRDTQSFFFGLLLSPYFLEVVIASPFWGWQNFHLFFGEIVTQF